MTPLHIADSKHFFDRIVNNIENKLSSIAQVPVVGTLAGCAKITLGTIQAITALACGILIGVPALCCASSSTLKHSWTHLTHGFGNIVAGALEAIPFIGYILFQSRVLQQLGSDIVLRIYTGQEDKFMPYSSIVDEDWKIVEPGPKFAGGPSKRDAMIKYHAFVEEKGGEEALSSSEKLALAQAAIDAVNRDPSFYE